MGLDGPVGLAVVALVFLAGLWVMHNPMLGSGLRLSHGDWGDARFLNYILEHSWRWLWREPIHQSFWDPPIFYPAKHTAAYSEVLLGAAPFYWVWRAFTVRPDTAFQLWMLTVSALNFGAAYWVSRRSFGLSVWGAAMAAFLFAFASARINQLNHQQLLPHWPTALALGAAHQAFATLGVEGLQAARRRVVAIHAFGLCVVWQLWAAFYLGWFLVLAVLLAVPLALVLPTERRQLFALVRRHPLALLSAAALSAAALYPLLWHYLEAAKEVGYRSFEMVQRMIPRPASWLDMGKESWAWGWLWERGFFQTLPMEHEHRIGFGLVGLTGGLAGLWLGRRRPGLRLVTATGALLVLIATVWPGLESTLWRQVYELFPGAQAIRAVSRVGLLVLLPAGLGVGLLFDRLTATRDGWAFAGLLAAFALWEQGQVSPSFDKLVSRAEAEGIAAGVGQDCEAFLWSPWREQRAPYWKVSVDGMWGALEANKPTLNGYSGHAPPHWHMGDPNLYHRAHEVSLGDTLGKWVARHGLDPARICWVTGQARVGENGARVVGQRVPQTLAAGEAASVEVTVQNLGPSTWRPETRHRLGAEEPQDNGRWGTHRVEPPGPVAPGETVTFRFDVRAPAQPGRHPFRWRMVQDGVAWFGTVGPFADIEVVAATPPPEPAAVAP